MIKNVAQYFVQRGDFILPSAPVIRDLTSFCNHLTDMCGTFFVGFATPWTWLGNGCVQKRSSVNTIDDVNIWIVSVSCIAKEFVQLTCYSVNSDVVI